MDNDDVVDELNDLIETCKDGEYGFQTCAEQAKSTNLKQLFQERAEGCRRAASELQSAVVRLGGDADTGGSALGALHRGWVSVRETLSTKSDLAVLEECERGEDKALAAYRGALEEDLPADIEELVRRQYDGAKRNHDQIRTLRDSMKASGS